jgi:hypothetical protein
MPACHLAKTIPSKKQGKSEAADKVGVVNGILDENPDRF